MSFLAPLFLAGALVVGLPILFHLIRRSTRERTLFSSLMFLHPSPPQLSRRSRLEHILLLLLRCAAVVLLALGFARPFLKQVFPPAPASGPARHTVVLLDTSASMRRQNLWAEARNRAEAAVRQAGPADQVALFSFDRQLKPLFTFEEWIATPAGDRLALARDRLKGLQPGWSGTHLDTALIRAAEMLAEGKEAGFEGARQVIVISDFQEGSETRALQGHEWPKGVEVVAEQIKPRSGNNAGIQLVTESGDNQFVGEPAVRVRVSNAGDSKHELFQVGWAGADGKYVVKPAEVYVPAGQNRIVVVPAAGTNAPFDRIVLSGDDEPFDNTVFVIPPQRTQVTVVYFGSDSPEDNRQPLFFLNRALQETRSQEVRVVAHRSSTPLAAEEIERATLLVLTDQLPESEARALRDAVTRGKTALCAPVSALAASTLSTILGTQVNLTEKRLGNYAMLAQIDFRHPLFAPFADPRFSDFSKLHFWKYRAADAEALPDARILARFDTGDSAMVDMPLGKGRVILWTACWHPTDSQLAVSSKFVPLLYSLLEYSGAASPVPRQFLVDAPVPLPEVVKGASEPSVRLPDGKELSIRMGDTNFSGTAMPGIYLVNGVPSQRRFAVNLEATESRTAPMAVDELERLGVPTGHSAPVALTETDRKIRLQNSELEARQKLWRWFIVATLAVLALETWLAGRTTRRNLPGRAPASPVIQEENA